jgi:hemerythrin HHE cation binding domain-containing protein
MNREGAAGEEQEDRAVAEGMGGPGPIAQVLGEDHARLDGLLSRSLATPGALDREAFDAFRAGLLRHIALEEKILFRAAREARGGAPLPEFRRLRIDHGALASLLVPTPTPEIVAEIRTILEPHNALEEGAGGLYDTCDRLLAARAAEIVERMRAYPPVRVAAYCDGPRVLRRAEDALRVSAKQFEGR